MGQKVNPKIFRIGTLNQWNSRWFSRKDYLTYLRQDITIKRFLERELKEAAVSQIDVERSATNITVIIHSAKPGIIIGRGGQGIEELKKKIVTQFLAPTTSLQVTIQEVTDPNTSAELIAQSIVADLERRMPFRRVMKTAIGRVERAGVRGVKVTVAGRLNGAEIARTETSSSGSLPLHTIRADIDYAQAAAHTTYGVIGIKVWIYKGEKFKQDLKNQPLAVEPASAGHRRRPNSHKR
ncbi:MAG: 30S ribosomal protein S3 [Candidatus Buchananbacteria bacterium RIFCSPLOWO2_01_FULL_56_15]|uniref:Small ribosomal subunit protein uS3 n=2 Tax=Candidatus Buchananiibacteriota TaxID=1817903 RepID=A0A1G1YJH3_9BACT|nr:MAG: 30S ribosomal protein S3 [Candidatus Buchananbacteria bacterium RIFCSPHIGHO2_02_FULL_56_16]OGY54893.1 MAG: 30S ribosomal protein S3 [Candidatus Buchananbacteria bacterium RIFCSPLOWO2_01_FULL_56_15]